MNALGVWFFVIKLKSKSKKCLVLVIGVILGLKVRVKSVKME